MKLPAFSASMRRLHLDFHNPAGIPDLGSRFDARRFAETIRAAGFDSATVFASCSHGHAYYPTATGVRHPARGFDLLGAMVEACHREGLTVGAYISLAGDHAKPGWLQADPRGRPRTFDDQGGYALACVNGPAVEKLVLPMTREILERYPLDAVWYDLMFFWDEGCRCRRCLGLMRRAGLSPENPEDVRLHMNRSIGRFAEKVADTIARVRPGVECTFNGLSIHERPAGLAHAAYVDIEALATGGWGYFYVPAKARYLRTLGRPVMGMTAAFHRSWGDFGTLKSRAQLEYECWTIAAAGCSLSVGDQMHPRGELEPARYARIGEVLGPIRTLEPLLRGARPVAEAAILLPPLGQGQFPKENWAAATKLLMEEKVQFDTVDGLADWSRYRLLVLPDDARPALREKVGEYLAGGGAVLATGGAARALPAGIVRTRGPDRPGPVYCAPAGALAAGIPDIPVVVKSGYRPAAAGAGAEVLARLVRPYPAKGPNAWYSSPQFPYAGETAAPMAVRKGRAVYVAADLFTEYWRYGYGVHRRLLSTCLDLLLPERAVRTNAPLAWEVALLETGKGMLCVVVPYAPTRSGAHVEQIEEWPPVAGVALDVAGVWRRATAPVSGEKLAAACRKGRTRVALGVVRGPTAILLENVRSAKRSVQR